MSGLLVQNDLAQKRVRGGHWECCPGLRGRDSGVYAALCPYSYKHESRHQTRFTTPRLMRPQESRIPIAHDLEKSGKSLSQGTHSLLKEKHLKQSETPFQSPRWPEGKKKKENLWKSQAALGIWPCGRVEHKCLFFSWQRERRKACGLLRVGHRERWPTNSSSTLIVIWFETQFPNFWGLEKNVFSPQSPHNSRNLQKVVLFKVREPALDTPGKRSSEEKMKVTFWAYFRL